MLARFDKVLIPEMNMGQLSLLVRARYLKDVLSLNKIKGLPFTRQEILEKIQQIVETKHVH